MTKQSKQLITEELHLWISVNSRAGRRPADMVAAMMAQGWCHNSATEALQQALATPTSTEQMQDLASHIAPATNLRSTQLTPEPALYGKPYRIMSDGHRVEVLITIRQPRVMVFGRLLSDAECVALMELAHARLVRSEAIKNETGGSETHAARTSDGMFFERGEQPLITQIETRIAELLCWPVSRGEGLQILRYRPGAEYKPHFDYFDPQFTGTPKILERGGQRLATLLIYLSTPECGGGTIFPDAGLEVAPVRGNAVFFSYDRAHPSTGTLHGGAPVTAGEKWVATKWLRQGIFV